MREPCAPCPGWTRYIAPDDPVTSIAWALWFSLMSSSDSMVALRPSIPFLFSSDNNWTCVSVNSHCCMHISILWSSC
ncbi:uncharacterized protein METZ01_LOCUS137739, partial [marine metagenome]